MDDEATPYYNDMIDQQALGLNFILKEFGKCARPRSAWQIDPFGHSREHGSLFAQFGFDGLFLGRIDYQDSDYRTETKTREMLWQASSNLGESGRIFTGILPNGYGPPPGFCFDIYCGDDPMMDDPDLDDYNVDKKVKKFLEYTHSQAEWYKTKNLIMTMGSDFQYSNAHMWYKNLDKLIYYVNKQQSNGSNVNIFYSTPACYMYSLYQENTTWPLKYDDFFPYAHRPHAFWTGYFTSRSALKDFVRRTNNYLQIVRQLITFANLADEETKNAINLLEREMGILQHHDAVSGTERQHVANDYSKRLSRGIHKCIDVIVKAFDGILFNLYGSHFDTPIFMCPLLNISQCEITSYDNIALILYNPLPREIDTWIQIPTEEATYQVIDVESGNKQLIQYSPVYNETKNIPERDSKAEYNLVWKAEQRPLGVKIYRIFKTSEKQWIKKPIEPNREVILSNEHLELTFDSDGNLAAIKNKDNSLTSNLKQNYCVYESMPGNNSEPIYQASGAYVFRPKNNSCQPLSVQSFKVYNGELFNEVHQIYSEWISQTIRLYKNDKNVEFEWQVGPIDVNDNIGREVVVKFDSDLSSNSLFYTDSNGREILKRKRNYRPTWNLNQTEKISGNYYPVNSRIFIRDELKRNTRHLTNELRQLTLVTDRSQGGSSIQDGSIEIMLHRRTLYDDALGVSEPLNEKGKNGKGLIIKGKINLLFDSIENSAPLHRELSHRINNRPLIFFTSLVSNQNIKKLAGWSPVKMALPSNVHLLTLAKDLDLDNQLENSFVVRLEHFYEKEEDKTLSQPVNVDLREFFSEFYNIVEVEELALGANIKVEELNERLSWKSDSDLDNIIIKKEKIENEIRKNGTNPFLFELRPMQIRTFRLWHI